ncbi:hypothetical protein FS837_001917, partial [Tulasnella sp. UAMH 9824]
TPLLDRGSGAVLRGCVPLARGDQGRRLRPSSKLLHQPHPTVWVEKRRSMEASFGGDEGAGIQHRRSGEVLANSWTFTGQGRQRTKGWCSASVRPERPPNTPKATERGTRRRCV